ncbi:hypothetical protein I6F36_06455 [Bradyrhizobium sp. BRP19]|uniref:hypothetical protein n=1 Tax=Bradyrhizobium sp. BRP19 TaxID=2793823 RepID=UPI001CD6D9F7|nr:hypothetical protein [Bradyrhizobium sp. BRP19]MCA1546446.1 hypothetical protein [Bradyrhizobium sp. BRP19]
MTKEPGGSIARPEPSHARTTFDHLPWPTGGLLGDVPPSELTARLIVWKIPGASHEAGREANAAAYARHLERLRTEAAAAAVNAWLDEAAQ